MNRLKRVSWRHLVPDILITAGSLYLSLILRTDFEETQVFLPVLHQLVPIFVGIRVSTFAFFGVYDVIWRYISMRDSLKILRALLLSTVLFISATFFVDIGRLPRSIFVIDFILSFLALTGVRVSHRLWKEKGATKNAKENARRTLILGAGSHGRALAERLHADLDSQHMVLGFIDDDPEKIGKEIVGYKVLGDRQILPRLLGDQNVQEVLVAIIDPPGDLVRDIMNMARPFNIRPRLISGPWKEGKKAAHFDILRAPELSDLLQRPKRITDHAALSGLVRGKTVLVTGAGGSIGSELTRQIYQYGPSRLLLMDHSEFGLYQIDHELRVAPVEESVIVPLLLDLRDRDLLQTVVRQYQPEIIFHAAAYKHVHLTEANPYSAMINNIEGTKNVLEVAEELGVQRFVLISSDKAVNPAGIMGATKRVCELMVDEVGRRTGRAFCAVRFGNVLGSSGSLIPLLQKQILNGEPVTLTHPDMARYFMLIPEAVALVLKAATLSSPGDILILRMGEPIKISEIARSLITLLGRNPDEIPVVFTGTRPGEKLVEELYLSGSEIKTSDPDVFILPRTDTALQNQKLSLMNRVDILLIQAHGASPEALQTLYKIISDGQAEYTPATAPTKIRSTGR